MNQLAPQFRTLLSFHYFRKADMGPLVACTTGGNAPDVFADSGAYSAWSQGAAVDLDEYMEWLTLHRGVFSAYASLDVIGDAEGSMLNQERMESAGFTPLPVFHAGEPWEVLQHYVQTCPYVGLGGNAGLAANRRMPWLVRCFREAAPYGTRLHGFGVTLMDALLSLPFWTVDSSSWGVAYRYGHVRVWDHQRDRFASFDVGTKGAARWGRLIRSYGFDPQDFEDRERYTREKAVGLAALSWAHVEAHLRKRNATALRAYLAPAGRPEDAEALPRVYLADGSMHNVMDAARTRAAHYDREAALA